MGLDIAEVIMDVEDAFAVRLDEGWNWDGTVGGLAAEVLRQRKPGTGPCLSGFAFRRLAPALALLRERTATGRIRPSTPLAEWPERLLRRSWRELEIDAGLRLPEPAVVRPLWLAIAAGLLGVGVAIAIGLLGEGRAMAWTAGILWLPVALAVAWLLAPRRLPAGVRTVGDLVRAALPLNVPRLERLVGPANEREVLTVVSRLVAERLAVDPALVRPDSHLVRDLGAD